MKNYLISIGLILATSLIAFGEPLVPNPKGPQKFEDLVGKTISLHSSESVISDIYWETPDTLWIKKARNPKVGKNYTLERNPYHGTLSDDIQYAPIAYDFFLFEKLARIKTGISPTNFLEKQRFKVLSVKRETRGSSSLQYSDSYRTTVVQLHLQNEATGDKVYWDILKTESKSFRTRTNYSSVSISLSDIADSALSSLETKDYYLGEDYSITSFQPCHIEGADFLIKISLASSYDPELEGSLYLFGVKKDGGVFRIDNASSDKLITLGEYDRRMETRLESLANEGHYNATLSKVRKPANSKIKNGKITEQKTEDNYLYDDNYLTFAIGAMEKEIVFFAQNKTDYTMKVLWDEAAFVTPNGSTQRVIHTGVTLRDKSQPQAPSVIPGHSILRDSITPSDNIRFSSVAGDWIIDPLIPKLKTKGEYPDGSTFSVLLPIDITGVTNEYLFVFELNWVYDNPEIRENYLKNHAEIQE